MLRLSWLGAWCGVRWLSAEICALGTILASFASQAAQDYRILSTFSMSGRQFGLGFRVALEQIGVVVIRGVFTHKLFFMNDFGDESG